MAVVAGAVGAAAAEERGDVGGRVGPAGYPVAVNGHLEAVPHRLGDRGDREQAHADAVSKVAQNACDICRSGWGDEPFVGAANDLDPIPGRSRLCDELSGARHVRGAPGAVHAGVQGVWAVALVAG